MVMGFCRSEGLKVFVRSDGCFVALLIMHRFFLFERVTILWPKLQRTDADNFFEHVTI